VVYVASSKAACGQAHSLAITDKGEVLAFGSSSVGALGCGPKKTQSMPRLIKMSTDFPVKMVAAGARHSFMITDDGRLFAFGDNSHGQLGLNKNGGSIDTPEALDVWRQQNGNCKHIVCGDNHTLALTESGKLYSWGANSSGQLGLGHIRDERSPQIIRQITEGVISIAAGCRHTVVVTNGGAQVWAWGSNTQGQLGIGAGRYMDGSQWNSPTLVPGLSNRRGMEILQVAAASCHSLVVTRVGEVYAFGDNTYGQLGFLRESSDRAPVVSMEREGATRAAREMDKPASNSKGVGKVWAPERVVCLSSYHIRTVSTADQHTLALAL